QPDAFEFSIRSPQPTQSRPTSIIGGLLPESPTGIDCRALRHCLARLRPEPHHHRIKMWAELVEKNLRHVPHEQQLPESAGEMAEWLKAHAWKACLGETLTWVRIPLSPPDFQTQLAKVLQVHSVPPVRSVSFFE